jgi:hypothetical protein
LKNARDRFYQDWDDYLLAGEDQILWDELWHVDRTNLCAQTYTYIHTYTFPPSICWLLEWGVVKSVALREIGVNE